MNVCPHCGKRCFVTLTGAHYHAAKVAKSRDRYRDKHPPHGPMAVYECHGRYHFGQTTKRRAA